MHESMNPTGKLLTLNLLFHLFYPAAWPILLYSHKTKYL